jgi:hypothetical protein
MRYRDQPTIEVTQRVRCDVGTAWTCVTEIDLPAQCSTELQAVDWLGDADGVTVGARFRGRRQPPCVRRLGDRVRGRRSRTPTPLGLERHRPRRYRHDLGFEVEPASDGVLIRQWGRMRPGPSRPTPAILAQPDKEARIVARRLSEWQQNMQANLDWIRAHVER